MTKAQLTIILLYLRSAHAFTDSAHDAAKATDDADISERLARLVEIHHQEVLRISDMRDALTSTPSPE